MLQRVKNDCFYHSPFCLIIKKVCSNGRSLTLFHIRYEPCSTGHVYRPSAIAATLIPSLRYHIPCRAKKCPRSRSRAGGESPKGRIRFLTFDLVVVAGFQPAWIAVVPKWAFTCLLFFHLSQHTTIKNLPCYPGRVALPQVAGKDTKRLKLINLPFVPCASPQHLPL